MILALCANEASLQGHASLDGEADPKKVGGLLTASKTATIALGLRISRERKEG